MNSETHEIENGIQSVKIQEDHFANEPDVNPVIEPPGSAGSPNLETIGNGVAEDEKIDGNQEVQDNVQVQRQGDNDEHAGSTKIESTEDQTTADRKDNNETSDIPLNTDDEESCALVLARYLLSVRNKDTHGTFLQDAVVGPFLSLCLASNSDRVVIGVLKVVNVLVKNRENLLRLKELLHFTDALQAASENEAIHISIRAKAAKFHDMIKNAKRPLGNNMDSSNMDKSDLSSSDCVKPLSSSREIHLHINHALNKERRYVITRALVKIDGIISVAFNPEQRLCIIRAKRTHPEVFGSAVANLGFECSLVMKNEKKEIVRVPVKPEKVPSANDENTKTPFYFPEDDEEEPVAPNAVARKGFNQREDGESWWDSAKKLARKSLFW